MVESIVVNLSVRSVRAKRCVRKMRSGAHAHLLETDHGDYVVKLFKTLSPRVRKILTVFFCLQVLDILTTMVGLHLGANEGSIFVARLLHFGPVEGLLISKGVGLSLAVTALMFDRERVVRFVNFWFAAVVGWNLIIISAIHHH